MDTAIKQTAFLVSMIDISEPINLDYPEDVARADAGERVRNINKLSAACSQLISIHCQVNNLSLCLSLAVAAVV